MEIESSEDDQYFSAIAQGANGRRPADFERGWVTEDLFVE